MIKKLIYFFTVLAFAAVLASCSKTEKKAQLPVAGVALLPGANVSAGATVQLNGINSSDYYGRLLSYHWSIVSQPAGSSAQLLNTNQPITYLIPDTIGTYVVQFIVGDGILTSLPVSTTINAGSGYPNLAAAYSPASPLAGQGVTISAVGSTDPNNKLLDFKWNFISTPAGSPAVINDANAPIANFLPDEDGTYIVQLQGSNGMFTSTTQLTITVGSGVPAASFNFSPSSVNTGQTVNLVSNSTDPNGYPLTYSYSFISVPSGSNAAINSSDQPVANFVPDIIGTYVVRLTVKDPYFSGFTQTSITINTSGVPYITYAGPTSQNVDPLDTVQVFGSAVDPNSNTMTYTWIFVSLPSGSSATFINTGTAASNITNPSFIADVQGQYVLSLTVKDDVTGYRSIPANVVITAILPFWNVNPTAALYATQTDWGGTNPISVFGPDVVKVGSLYYMWYSGSQGSNNIDAGGTWSIGISVSTDGITWTTPINPTTGSTVTNPIITPAMLPTQTVNSANSYTNVAAAHPYVIYDPSNTISPYKMWFAGATKVWNTTNTTNYWYFWQIYYSTSNDGINWLAPQIVVPNRDIQRTNPWGRDGRNVSYPSVIYTGNSYIMWAGYGVHDWSIFTNEWADNDIVNLVSYDGITWFGGNYDTLPTGGGNTWDGWSVLSPGAIFNDGMLFKMWFGGADNTTGIYRIGAAYYLNGGWQEDLSNPVLVGILGWNNQGVSDPQVNKENNMYKMWFSGWDGSSASIGYATRP